MEGLWLSDGASVTLTDCDLSKGNKKVMPLP